MTIFSNVWNYFFEDFYNEKYTKDRLKFENYLSSKYPEVTLYYKKRYADTDNKIILPMNVCDFIKPFDSIRDDKGVEKIWNENITYISDNYRVNNIPDYYQLPFETNILRKGDCEDSSFYRVSKLKSNGSGANFGVAFGLYKGGGHAFPIFIKDDEIYILEATTSDYVPILYSKQSDYEIYYISNERKSWCVNSDLVFGKLMEVNYAHNKRRKISKKLSPFISNSGKKKKSEVKTRKW
jgi:hypothetical protein